VAEKKLWRRLRELRSQGYHFRRQAPVEGFIVDFACLAQKLVIEVDGHQHWQPRERQRDAERDAHLCWKGFRVLRFTNADVMRNEEAVLLAILAALGAAEKHD
jgi:very-short-patch-repair endonuclease